MRLRLFIFVPPVLVAACTSLIGFPDLPDVGPDSGAGNDAGPSGTDAASVEGGGGDASHPGDADAGAEDSSPDVAIVQDGCGGGACADVTCTGTEIACGGACFDLSSSAANCGRCGHSCGAGQCQSSQCQAAALIDSIDVPTGFAVDENGIYFAVDGVLKSCPLAGCKSGERQIATLQNMSLVAAANGSVVFIGDDPAVGILDNPISIFACPTTGCPDAALPAALIATPHGPSVSPQLDGLIASGSDIYLHEVIMPVEPTHIERCAGLSGTSCTSERILPPVGLGGAAGAPSWSGTIANPIAADATQAYFVQQYPDGGTSISATGNEALCDAAPCTTPVLWGSSPSRMVAYGGTLYFIGTFEYESAACTSSFGCGPVFSCPATGCTEPTAVATLTASSVVNDIAADSSGVYFTIGSVVDSCPLTGCGIQGPVSVATGQASPTILRVSGGFVYWVNAGTGAGTGSIVAVAEP